MQTRCRSASISSLIRHWRAVHRHVRPPGQAKRIAHGVDIELQHRAGRHRTAHHTGESMRVKNQIFKRVLVACILQTTLYFEAFSHRQNDLLATQALCLGQGKRHRHSW